MKWPAIPGHRFIFYISANNVFLLAIIIILYVAVNEKLFQLPTKENRQKDKLPLPAY
jgi:hypothetical protein